MIDRVVLLLDTWLKYSYHHKPKNKCMKVIPTKLTIVFHLSEALEGINLTSPDVCSNSWLLT